MWNSSSRAAMLHFLGVVASWFVLNILIGNLTKSLSAADWFPEVDYINTCERLHMNGLGGFESDMHRELLLGFSALFVTTAL